MSNQGIAHVALTVRDLSGMASFYEQVMGLTPMGQNGEQIDLGAGGQVLISLQGDKAAQPLDPRDAGLFHTAFLLPDRASLGAWLLHAADTGVRLSGASDHGVSEALYLNDPEGNGIEIYRDRPDSEWIRHGDRIEMFTARLDLNDLMASANGPRQMLPDGSIIGHVHLQVGDLAVADKFMQDELRLTQTFDAQGAAWYGWNGYHHHLAANTWNSRGAGQRTKGRTGLAHIALHQDVQPISDPWGTRFVTA